MAQELNIKAFMEYSPSVPGISSVSLGEHNRLFDVEGSRYVAGSQRIETTEEIDANNELASIGYCYVSNIGEKNVVIVVNGEDALLLKPREFAIFRPDDRPYARAKSGVGYIEYFMLEN